MQSYHLRRSEKEIADQDTLHDIIAGQKYMTLAMCKDNEPYLATVNYGYNAEERCFYFHCAGEGKKMDYLRSNAIVWGQIVEDHGYLVGRCDHAFRTVQFRGTVTLLQEDEEKRRALNAMIDQLEPDPEPVKQRLMTEQAVARVTIGKVAVDFMSGKQSQVPTQEAAN